MSRIVTLDVAKAICIIFVVVGHYVPDNAPAWWVMLRNVIYTFHMPLFMFASGFIYIATKKDLPYGTFLMKKVKRLMVPYWVTSFIVISIKILTQGSMSVDHPVNVVSYLKMFYMPEAGAFLWFILALWWMFMVVPLLKTKRNRMLFFLFCLIVHYVPVKLPGLFCIEQCKNMFVFFMLGVICFDNRLLHRFVSGYNLCKVAFAVSLFAVSEALFLMNSVGGGKM